MTETIARFTDNGYQIEISGHTAKVQRIEHPTYYLSLHMIETSSRRATLLWLCSCPDFTTGRPAKGISPFDQPCKHVQLLKKRICSTEMPILIPQKEEA